jgi:cytochrome c oxidase accessory protein FixG
MCTIACPYGRFQSILLDAQTWVVGYDKSRGEPRGKAAGGDCVDCNRCVQVCPTGIDIRNGIQMECINCLECADACDVVMEKIKKPTGLIRFLREPGQKEQFRIRPLIYCVVSVVLIGVFGYRLLNRDLLQISMASKSGTDFQVLPSGIENRVQLWLENKSPEVAQISFAIQQTKAHLTMAQPEFAIQPFERKQITVFVNMPSDLFQSGVVHSVLSVRSKSGAGIVKEYGVPLTLFGPQ